MALISTFIVDAKRLVRTFSVLLCLAVFGSSYSSFPWSSAGEVCSGIGSRASAEVGSCRRIPGKGSR